MRQYLFWIFTWYDFQTEIIKKTIKEKLLVIVLANNHIQTQESIDDEK